MDQLHLMQVYVAVAEEEGFAAGARRLAMSPPAVTRAVSKLEDQLGVKLLNRTTRYVRATEAGLRYLQDAKRILADVKTANDAAAGINASPQGKLTITAPTLFGRLYVMPGIVEYLNQFPQTQIEAIYLDRVVNLLEEGIDVGVRIGQLPDSSMRALKVGTVRLVLCASSNYVRKNGKPSHPKELDNHTLIKSTAVSNVMEWRFYNGGETLYKITPRLSVTSNDAAIEAVKHDLGITRVLSYQVAPLLASGKIQTILEEYEPEPLPVHIVHRESHLTTAKVRSFIDLMAKRLKRELAIIPDR